MSGSPLSDFRNANSKCTDKLVVNVGQNELSAFSGSMRDLTSLWAEALLERQSESRRRNVGGETPWPVQGFRLPADLRTASDGVHHDSGGAAEQRQHEPM